MRRSRSPLLVLVALLGCHSAPIVTEAAAQAERLKCTFKAGALAKDTLGTTAPVGSQIPIDHIVLIIQENHSFDSLFSQLNDGAVVAPSGVTNSIAGGMPVPRQRQPHECLPGDIDHSWNGSHEEYDNGLNDGFASVNTPAWPSMDYYGESDIPYYYAVAQAFAISDAHFCSVLAPTDPNRMYSLAATSFGLVTNAIAPAFDAQGKPYPNIFTELDAAKVTWKYYVDTSPPESAVFLQTYLTDAPTHYAAVADFMRDAAAGNLPSFSIVEGHATSDATSQDEHPPADIQVGQAFAAGVMNALMSSPNWPGAALFFTYDEHGGFYDSVPPPQACPPDDLQPMLSASDTYLAQFDRYGFRVPLIVVSPYAKRGYVSHVVSDHTSVLRFIEARFGLPAMTARDANADPLFDLFDFTHPDTSIPPLPEATIDPAEYSYCTTLIPANSSP